MYFLSFVNFKPHCCLLPSSSPLSFKFFPNFRSSGLFCHKLLSQEFVDPKPCCILNSFPFYFSFLNRISSAVVCFVTNCFHRSLLILNPVVFSIPFLFSSFLSELS
jgi:hypothetical protein